VEYLPDDGITRYTEGDGTYEFHYDDDGFVTKIVDPFGGEKVRERDGDRIVREIDCGGREVRWIYDAGGTHVARKDRFGYSYPPELEQANMPNPFVRRLPATALARLFAGLVERPPIESLGAASSWLELVPPSLVAVARETFPARENLAASRRGVAVVEHDALGRRLVEVDAAGRRREWKYDATGNVVSIRDRDGKVTERRTVSWNLVGKVRNALGHAMQYRYSSLEQIVGVTDPHGNVTRYDYDAKRRLVRIHRFGRLREEYVYDEGDHFVEKRDGAGEVLFSNEAHDNHLVAVRRLASGGEHRFDYDRHGRVTEASTDEHEITLAYDALGRRREDLRDGEGVEHWYFRAEGSRTRVLGKFVVATHAPDSGRTILVDATGRETWIRHERGGWVQRSCGNGTTELLAYDDEGRLLARLVHRGIDDDARAIWSVRYSYTAEGDLVRIADSVRGTTLFEVDDAHRLVAEIAPDGRRLEYVQDAADNVVAAPGLTRLEIGAGNRAVAAADEVFEYGARDHIATRRRRDGATVRYVYDSFDMLREIEGVDASGRPTPPWRAAYDALGRRLWSECGDIRREFWWDGDRLAAELLPAGKLRIYGYASAEALVPLSFTDFPSREADPDAGATYHVFSDPSGMPVLVQDDRGRAVWWTTRIDPFGSLQLPDDVALEYNLRWPGHYFDPETGLHYNRWRYYDPQLRRYLQSDPSGYGGSDVNLYAYCPNPLVQVDVLGLSHPGNTDPAPTRPGDGDGGEKPPRSPDEPEPRPPGPPPDPYPPRTAEAQAECQKVVDTMADMGMSQKKNKVVTVFTHEDGTVSVGISGADGPGQQAKAAALETRLNEGHDPPKYRVATETMPTDNIHEQPGGNAPGVCAEPHAAQAAHPSDSPITGTDTRWRGKEENPHPFSGQNADGAPVQPQQMDPCATCGDPGNAGTYMDHANG
jgi:RHS repeat-associated protein